MKENGDDIMENDISLNRPSKIILGIVALIIIAIASFIIYKNYQEQTNTNSFKTYLTDNGYEKEEDGIYTKETNENSHTENYKAFFEDYLLYYSNMTSTNKEVTNISLGYKQDGSVDVTYKLEGYTNSNDVGTLYQKGTYKDGEFDCEIVTNGGFDTRCDVMKEEAENFYNETNQIFKNNNINIKYIKFEN